jgi:hypothetical protein
MSLVSEGKKEKTLFQQKEEWPSLSNHVPSSERKGSVWQSINESSVNKPTNLPKRSQQSHQSSTPQKIPPSKEVWPALNSFQTSGWK